VKLPNRQTKPFLCAQKLDKTFRNITSAGEISLPQAKSKKYHFRRFLFQSACAALSRKYLSCMAPMFLLWSRLKIGSLAALLL
jgi:hypothetical protein